MSPTDDIRPSPYGPPPYGPPPVVVVMGVSGVGKSAVGEALARRLGVEYADADRFHPAANVAMMSAGRPLTEADRAAWLESVGGWLAEHDSAGGVMACSALRRSHRDRLRRREPRAVFAHLDGSPEMIARRLASRRGHFMPASLLSSQLAALEPLQPDEPGFTVDAGQDVETVVGQILARLTADP